MKPIHSEIEWGPRRYNFCEDNGKVLIAGGDTYKDGKATNVGNKDSNIVDPGDDSLTQSKDAAGSAILMKRARWYGSPTTLPDGRIYIQGGWHIQGSWDGGEAYPEVRA